jgi:hypothetical protein
MNVSHPNVVAPFTTALPPLPNIVSGVSYKYVLTGGNYILSTLSLSSSDKMLVTGHAQLLVNLDVSVSGSIIVAPGASLQLYLKSGSVSLSGNGFRNQTGFSGNMAFWCMPNVLNVNISGDGEFVGTLYAPQAKLSLSGGGSTGMDFIGAAVCNELNGSGTYRFHYDEGLQNTGLRQLAVVSWKEI